MSVIDVNIMECCRICIQNCSEMRSIYEIDSCGKMKIIDKICICANITNKVGKNVPNQICEKCLDDLQSAYRFKLNCEMSESILKSFLDESNNGEIITDLIMQSDSGEIYKYEPPHGLKVKRIVQQEPIQLQFQEELLKNESDTASDYIDRIEETYEQSDSDTEYKPTYFEIKQTKQKQVEKMPNSIVKTVEKSIKTNAVVNKKKASSSKAPLKICDICGNTYKFKHALDSHMRRHRNEKPFPCEICGRSFVINFELRRHMRTHTGQKPYACQFCDRRFSDYGSRIKHERTHTGERPYKCDTCDKAFAYSHVLANHKLIHTGEKRYSCDECQKKFTKSHHLKAHKNTHSKQNKQHKDMTVPTTLYAPDLGIVKGESNDSKAYDHVLDILTNQPKLEDFSIQDDYCS